VRVEMAVSHTLNSAVDLPMSNWTQASRGDVRAVDEQVDGDVLEMGRRCRNAVRSGMSNLAMRTIFDAGGAPRNRSTSASIVFGG
jgi:hypothetical protein